MDEPVYRYLPHFVGGRIQRLQGGYLADQPAARAILAQARRAISQPIGANQEVWQFAFDGVDDDVLGRADQPAPVERAIHDSFCLYAVHQQSQREPMHRSGIGLGTAVRSLASPHEADSREKPVMRRFNALSTAVDHAEIRHHLQGLIQQFRSANIALDYGQLASDLFRLQYPSMRDGVRLEWARQSLRTRTTENTDAQPADTTDHQEN